MQDADLFQLIMIAYWLALATWFGGALFIAIAAQVIHRTVREANPILPNVLAVNLEGQHSTLLSGTVVSQLLNRLTLIELICAGVLLVASVGQFFLADLTSSNQTAFIMRVTMICIAAGIVVYDWRVVWPKIQIFRKQYIDHADDPEIANPAKDQFDREQKQSVSLLMIVLFLLLGTILFSGTISPKKTILSTSTDHSSAVEK